MKILLLLLCSVSNICFSANWLLVQENTFDKTKKVETFINAEDVKVDKNTVMIWSLTNLPEKNSQSYIQKGIYDCIQKKILYTYTADFKLKNGEGMANVVQFESDPNYWKTLFPNSHGESVLKEVCRRYADDFFFKSPYANSPPQKITKLGKVELGWSGNPPSG